MSPAIAEALGSFATTLTLHDIPSGIIDRAKVSLLHNLGISLLNGGEVAWVTQLVRDNYAKPEDVTLLAGGGKAAADGAVMANAAALHAGSQDDVHVPSTSHPGVIVTPPALAVAETRGASGADFLRAIVVGYEVMGRIGRRHDQLVTKRGFRSSCMCGPFGAAAAAGLLMGLDGTGVGRAIALAANQCGGLGQTFRDGTTEWLWQLGLAARNGLFAARSAAAGVDAAPRSIEGEAGFLSAYAGTAEYADRILDGLRDSWVLSEVALKAFPVCAILQRPVQSAIDIATENDLTAGDVAAVELALCPFEANYPGTNNRGPYLTMTATTMSAQFVMGLAVGRRRASLADVLTFDDTQTLETAKSVSVVSDPTLPVHASRLTIRCNDGRRYVRSDDGVETEPRYSALAKRLLDQSRSVCERQMAQLVDAIERLDTAKDITSCLAAFSK